MNPTCTYRRALLDLGSPRSGSKAGGDTATEQSSRLEFGALVDLGHGNVGND